MRLALTFALALVFGAAVGAQTAPEGEGDEPVARVTAALEAGDAEALLAASAARVELVLFEQSGLYSRGQAALVLEAFFERNPPARVILAEQALADDGRAAMGRYWTGTSEDPLRVYVRLRPADEAWEVDAVRIERGSPQNIGGLP